MEMGEGKVGKDLGVEERENITGHPDASGKTGKIEFVRKRDGRLVAYDRSKITEAIFKAVKAVGGEDREKAEELARQAENYLLTQGYEVPDIEEIQDAVEKILIENGHAKTAKAFILYRDWRNRQRSLIKVRKSTNKNTSTTDLSLLVYTPQEEVLLPWDKNRITNALIKECQLSPAVANAIATAVEGKVFRSGLKETTTTLIREMVNNELLIRGYRKKLATQQILGVPVYNLEQVIYSKSKENSNISANNPEAVNLTIAEQVLKQYSLQRVFSPEVSEAHLRGIIHIHDLGYPTRVYCSSHSLEYLKKYGLELENLDTSSLPAAHARTLTGHLNTFLASMQAYYAGALGVGYLNVFYAPYLVGMSDKEMKQEAQYLIFSGSQNAFSRGGQTLFLDFNIHTGIPRYLEDVPAIGPRGKATGKTYKAYKKEAMKFARALMEVWLEGDRHGHVFAFPKMDLHVNADTFEDPEQFELLKFASYVASENGTPYFIFDRDEVTLAACCRLRYKVTDDYMIRHPESMRFCGFQNVTINLPQAAYRAGKGNLEKLFREIDRTFELVMKAHMEKRDFIHELMKAPGLPLWEVGKIARDGFPYIDLDKVTYIVGIVGLNECVQYLVGQELHQDEETYKLGLKIISYMFLKAKEYSKRYGLKISLEESPAESATRRLAKIDMENYPESIDVIKGDIKGEEYYYTNSIHFRPDAPITLVERIEKQAKFHPLIESGAIIHAFIGEEKPSAEGILNLVSKTFHKTPAAQLTISPEFTVCNDCRRSDRGLKDVCAFCGSFDTYGITRIVGYFSRVNNWNKSKIGELKDRHKGNYAVNGNIGR